MGYTLGGKFPPYSLLFIIHCGVSGPTCLSVLYIFKALPCSSVCVNQEKPYMSTLNGLKGWFVQSAPADSGFTGDPLFPGTRQYIYFLRITQNQVAIA